VSVAECDERQAPEAGCCAATVCVEGSVSQEIRIVGNSYAVLWDTLETDVVGRFRVVSILSMEPRLYGHLPDETSDAWEAEVEIEGHLKFDGCLDWSTDADCALHHCRLSELQQLWAVWPVVYELGRKHLRGWCGS